MVDFVFGIPIKHKMNTKWRINTRDLSKPWVIKNDIFPNSEGEDWLRQRNEGSKHPISNIYF